MASLSIIDVGDRYIANWQGDQIRQSGGFEFGPCAPPDVGGFTFGGDVGGADIEIRNDLDDPAIYPGPIYSVGLTVGIVGITVVSWGCACGQGCHFGNNLYEIVLLPAIGDYQGNPVETTAAATGYTAFLGFRNPNTWPDLLWRLSLEGVNSWLFQAYATAVAYKVIPPSQPPPDPPDTPVIVVPPTPLVPPCAPVAPGAVAGGPGPSGRVRICEDC